MAFGVGKRLPDLPRSAMSLSAASKSEILEAAWHLASLANDSGSADDEASTLERLRREIDLARRRAGRSPLKA